MPKPKPPDEPAVIRFTTTGHPAFKQYVGQTAAVQFTMGDKGDQTWSVAAVFADGRCLSLQPGDYELVSGKLPPPQKTVRVRSGSVAQTIRMRRADRAVTKAYQRSRKALY